MVRSPLFQCYRGVLMQNCRGRNAYRNVAVRLEDSIYYVRDARSGPEYRVLRRLLRNTNLATYDVANLSLANLCVVKYGYLSLMTDQLSTGSPEWSGMSKFKADLRVAESTIINLGGKPLRVSSNDESLDIVNKIRFNERYDYAIWGLDAPKDLGFADLPTYGLWSFLTKETMTLVSVVAKYCSIQRLHRQSVIVV